MELKKIPVITARLASWGQPVLVFLIVLSWQLHNITNPAFWPDEVATISAATRPVSALSKLVQNVDVVHAVYYFVMHFWLKIFSVSHFTLRLPEAILVALAAVFLFVILKPSLKPLIAWLAVIFFAVMPTVVWAGGLGRSYAFAVFLATVLIFVIQRIDESARVGLWWYFGYFALAALACSIFIYLVLFVAVQITAVWALRVEAKKCLGISLAGLLGVLVSSPVALLANEQSTQLSWIKLVDSDAADSLLGSALFHSDAAITVSFWSVIGIGFLLFLVRTLMARKIERRGFSDAEPKNLAPMWFIAVALFFVPETIVYVYSNLNAPIFIGRYFLFSASAAAMLLALALYELRFKGLQIAVGLLVISLAFSTAISVRQNFAFNNNNDNDKVAEHIQNNAVAGDAVLFEPHRQWCTGICSASIAYASQLSKTTVIGVTDKRNSLGQLFERYQPRSVIFRNSLKFDRVWFVHETTANTNFKHRFVYLLTSHGYRLKSSKVLSFESVSLYERK